MKINRNVRSVLSLTLVILLTALLAAGCASEPAETGATSRESAPAGEGAQGGDAPEADGADETDEADQVTAPEKVLLAVSFGTSYDDTREATIGAVERALADAYPDYEVRRAFTSGIIIGILGDRGIEVDSVTEAMDRLVAEGVREVVIQPTHVISGYEYSDIVDETAAYADRFDSFAVGVPLLNADADYEAVASVIVADTAQYNAGSTAIVFMGHGTEHEDNAAYARLQEVLFDAGHDNYFVGTVEAEPDLDEVMELVEAHGAEKVVLLPLMIVAGDHANNDMAGDDEDSWKSEFEAAGYEVECVLKGLGEYPGIRQLIVAHAGEMIG